MKGQPTSVPLVSRDGARPNQPAVTVDVTVDGGRLDDFAPSKSHGRNQGSKPNVHKR